MTIAPLARVALLCLMCAAGLAIAARSYDQAEALKFVQYSRAAFCSQHAVESWTCGDICRAVPVVGEVRFIPEGSSMGVQGYVARIPGEQCLVAFRGSLNLKNWYADFDGLLKPWPPSDGDRANASYCKGW